ncbi:MAG TPA: hypothetical protein VGL61_04895 [Kofleriaceae bacterium]|jgi:hypothetical protein
MRFGALALVTVLACGFPKLASTGDGGDGGDGGMPGSGGTLLSAIDEPVAKIGDTITLEGSFTAPLVVGFPGNVTATATVLGPNRATVVVPIGATAGQLSVAASGGAVSLPFRATTFNLALDSFDDNYRQASYARAMPQQRISYAQTLVTDRYVYVLGGASVMMVAPTPTNAITRARINADGTLGEFVGSDAHLSTARGYATSARIGDAVYLIGGEDAESSALASIDTATINSDGTLGGFAQASVSLTTPRFDPTSAVIGNWLYVIGGEDATGMPLDTIERAPINDDGTLGAFGPYNGVELVKPRYGAACVVVDSTVYVIGGATTTMAYATGEQATIGPDGSLGMFSEFTLTTARLDPFAFALQGSLYIIGGSTSPTVSSVTSGEIVGIGSNGASGTDSNLPFELMTARAGAAVARVGNFVYAIGGADAATDTVSTIEHASIIGGHLGAFAPTDATSLQDARYGHVSVVVGDYLYELGGKGSGDALLQTVERAPIGADGTIGPFAVVNGAKLLTEHYEATAAVLGDYLYVIAGDDGGQLGTMTVEKAQINYDDDSLGGFTEGGTLNIARYGAATAILDDYVFVFGGREALTGAQDGEFAVTDGSGNLIFDTSTAELDDAVEAPNTVVARNQYYVLLGDSADIQVATIAFSETAATVGSFGVINGGPLPAVEAASTVVVGDYLYILGGSIGGTDEVNITTGLFDDDGSLGSILADSSGLASPLSGETSIVLGNNAYLLGGHYAGSAQAAVLVAPID